MFNWLKRKNSNENNELNPEKSAYLSRLRQGLSKTRDGLFNLFSSNKKIDEDLIEELETLLLMADVGMDLTQKLITNLRQAIKKENLQDSQELRDYLALELEKILINPPEKSASPKPEVILMVGINGAGKTTTIGKLANKYLQENKKIMLAAADTFRAAAVEQLQTWGERNNVPVIAQGSGADPAAVAFDALQAAQARNVDVLIIDTAGRLHTQNHLMEELQKIKRVIKRLDESAPHQTLLVLDAGTGQNALKQAQIFHQALNLDGLILSKFDGTAKGGIVFPINEQLKIPVLYLGIGEQKEDLRLFDSGAFIRALLYND